MYAYARSCVRIGDGYSEEFAVKVGVHQGSVLSPLLFIIVLEALSCRFRTGIPWEDLYADDLVIIADSLDECVKRLLTWKEAMERKGLRVNASKTKIMICGTGFDRVWMQALGAQEMQWTHAPVCGHRFRCSRCRGTARPLDNRPQSDVQVGLDKLEVVGSFCYLGHAFHG
ncbi:uncharacterized protein LOC125669061 [Ostrea edulis]|uniref:uncharacterized protein LOC125669061 n=1 Tax=Ostrea edulis TaxID=37623 RepID=UPI0024AFE15B|nr:uncharacterized protein LOC125669061 [Ostrea edulis]